MLNRCHIGDCRSVMRGLIAEGVKVQTVVTSPPYFGLRDYGVPGQLGLERTPERYLARMRSVFRLVWDLLADDGTVWLNMGDSYYSPRVGGGVGSNSTINGQRTQAAFRDAQRARSPGTKLNHSANAIPLAMNRRRGLRHFKPKDMFGMPWMLALILRADGWYLRQEIIWHKKNPMPESVRDRCTKSHEHVFLLAKSERYYFDAEAIKEPASPDTHARYARGRSDSHKYADGGPGNQTIARGFEHMRKPVSGWAGEGSHTAREHARGPKDKGRADQGLRDSTKFGRDAGWRKLAAAGSGIKNNESFDEAMAVMPEFRNKRSVWTLATEAFKGAHFATFPRGLVEPCILAGSRPGDVVFDPFIGSGTTAEVAESLGRCWIGCELNPDYEPLQRKRLRQACLPMGT